LAPELCNQLHLEKWSRYRHAGGGLEMKSKQQACLMVMPGPRCPLGPLPLWAARPVLAPLALLEAQLLTALTPLHVDQPRKWQLA